MKSSLLHLDALLQMQFAMEEVQRVNFASVFFNMDPVNPCLILCVMRENLVSSAIDQLGHLDKSELKKPLKVIFVGEEAIDAGGVQKEFFMLIMREILDPKYGMFRYFDDSGKIWFNSKSFEDTKMFRLVGLVCGLAIYNNMIISLPFPLALYKKLLDRKIIIPKLSTTAAPEERIQLLTMPLSLLHPLTIPLLPTSHPNHSSIVVLYNGLSAPYPSVRILITHANLFRGVLSINIPLTAILGTTHLPSTAAATPRSLLHDCDILQGEYSAGHPTIKFFWQVFREMSVEDKKKFLASSPQQSRPIQAGESSGHHQPSRGRIFPVAYDFKSS
eukprot:XP_011676757.1 PREDICTED: probable E3 ubiquitin-protein ligase HERC4 [Strongylocentrotus purpuratus]